MTNAPKPEKPAETEAVFPVAQGPSEARTLAPAPQVDRFPIILGQNVSLQVLANISRMALTGYRQQYVDLLDELLEKDGHLFSVVQKRILTVACGKVEITPPKKTKNDGEKCLALEVAEFCDAKIKAIPDLVTHLQYLQWATYYALGCCETHWDKKGSEWGITRLSGVHSRRLAYPDFGAWDLYVWDQGQVLSPYRQPYGVATTNGTYGLRIGDYPGKFVVHAPQLRGDYPTREGLGRQVSTWVILKLIAARGAAQYLERFAKPWPEATYATDGDDGHPRTATDKDIAEAEAALAAVGAGSLSGWTHPDSIKLDLRTPDGQSGGAGKLSFKEWLEYCNAEHSKVTLGGTLTTEVGHSGGNRSLGQTQQQSEKNLYKYDAKVLAETIRRDIVSWLVRLNFPPAAMALLPTVTIHVGDEPNPTEVLDRGEKAATMGMAVDADALAEEAGIPVLDPDDRKGRRLVLCLPIDPTKVDADLAERAAELAPEEPEPDQNAVVQPGEPGPAPPPEGGEKPAKSPPPAAPATN